MGRCYAFECPRCNFRAQISGGADSGDNCQTTTILCRDCRRLYDVATFLRLPVLSPPLGSLTGNWIGARPPGKLNKANLKLLLPGHVSLGAGVAILRTRPPFGLLTSRPDPRWVELPTECPVSRHHKIDSWKHPGKCPKCGADLDRSLVPFRIWS